MNEEEARETLHSFDIREGGNETKQGWIIPPGFVHWNYKAGDIVTGTALEVCEELDILEDIAAHERDRAKYDRE